jgi:hypothetical protein
MSSLIARWRLSKWPPLAGWTVAISVWWLALSSIAQENSSADALQQLLQRRVRTMQTRINDIDAQIGVLQRKNSLLHEEIAKLIRELESLQTPENSEEPEIPPAPKPRQVLFRPPLLRYVEKDTPLAIVCRNGQVALIDFVEYQGSKKRILADQGMIERLFQGEELRLAAGDFDIVWKPEFEGSSRERIAISQEAQPKRSTEGEDFSDAVRTGSRLEVRLRDLDDENSVIQFVVYPDSFDGFRQVRNMVWKRKFGVNWVPMSHAEPIFIGGGSGGVGQQ